MSSSNIAQLSPSVKTHDSESLTSSSVLHESPQSVAADVTQSVAVDVLVSAAGSVPEDAPESQDAPHVPATLSRMPVNQVIFLTDHLCMI